MRDNIDNVFLDLSNLKNLHKIVTTHVAFKSHLHADIKEKVFSKKLVMANK